MRVEGVGVRKQGTEVLQLRGELLGVHRAIGAHKSATGEEVDGRVGVVAQQCEGVVGGRVLCGDERAERLAHGGAVSRAAQGLADVMRPRLPSLIATDDSLRRASGEPGMRKGEALLYLAFTLAHLRCFDDKPKRRRQFPAQSIESPERACVEGSDPREQRLGVAA